MGEAGVRTFRDVFGENRPPFPYQERVFAALRSGKNVILRAPTGAGKTEAALYPFLAGLPGFPPRLLYVAPLRVLLYQLRDRCAKYARGRDVRVQTGERREDPLFEADATFTTIDQMVSSFLHVPYSLTPGRSNVNAGAIVGSYVVVDEFHLLDPDASLPTTFELLRLCRASTPFLLMTATCSPQFAADLAKALAAECISPTSEELSEMPGQQKTRRWRRVDSALEAEAVLAAHQALRGDRRRSIVVCNTVEKAQSIFEALGSRSPDAEMLLLHNRFFSQDRRRTEARVTEMFSRDATVGTNAILIATQAIEVGLDITCEALHTELAPVSALVQRAGRCARYQGEDGSVFVYDLDRDEGGRRRYGPYRGDIPNDSLPELIDRTWQALGSLPGGHIDWEGETHLMACVQEEQDRALLAHVRAANRKEAMQKIAAMRRYGDLRSLIRRDESVTVIVHERPEELASPYAVEGLSLYHGTLRGWLQRRPADVPWFLKAAIPDNRDESQELSGKAPGWCWQEVTRAGDLVPGRTIAVHPAAVTYQSDLGLRFGPPSHPRISPLAGAKSEPFQKFGYHSESYIDHVRRVVAAYEAEHAALVAPVSERLKRADLLDKACRIAIALHDAGKLTVAWQDWAHAWQRARGNPVPDHELLAHTDLNPEEENRQTLPGGLPRPPHAVEGACAVYPWLVELLPQPFGDIVWGDIVWSAIARHHQPLAGRFGVYRLHPRARDVLREALAAAGVDTVPSAQLHAPAMEGDVGIRLLPREFDETFLAYSMVARCLRLSDWAGTAS